MPKQVERDDPGHFFGILCRGTLHSVDSLHQIARSGQKVCRFTLRIVEKIKNERGELFERDCFYAMVAVKQDAERVVAANVGATVRCSGRWKVTVTNKEEVREILADRVEIFETKRGITDGYG